jgi:hypothetical protein
MNFSKIVISVSAAALMMVLGCSSSSTSDTGSSGLTCGAAGDKNCPNDVAQTQMAVDSCNKCLSQLQAYDTCEGVTSKPACGADGKSVVAMTDQTKCMTQLMAVSTCFAM